MTVPWLCCAGNEVSNGNRVLTYARASGDPRLSVALMSPLVAETGGAVPENLAAFCAAIEADDRTPNDVTYIGPAIDPAPWYVASRPDSGEFLGLYLTDIRVGSVISRSIAARTPVGGVLGPLRRGQRVVSMVGTLFAATDRGMRYGERWLNDVLSGADCDRGDDAHILLACDPAQERVLPWAGILDPGVIVAPVGDVPECLMQQASFQLASPLPWLEGLPDELASEALTSEADTVTAVYTAPEWTGDAAIIVEVVTAAPVSDLTVTAAVPLTDECPAARPPFVTVAVPALRANRTLRIDAARRVVTVTETSSGLVVGGMDALAFTGLFRWIEIGACTTVCVAVGGGSFTDDATTVTITAVPREL